MAGGGQRETEPGRPPRRGPPAASDHHRGIGGQWPGRYPHGLAVPVDGLAAPGSDQILHALIHDLAPLVPVLAVGQVLRRPVAQTEGHSQTAAADQVQHDQILGDPERIVQRQQQSLDDDGGPLGSCRDQTGEQQRGRHPAVVGAVVLLGLNGPEAGPVSELCHLDGGLVTLRELGWIEAGQD